METGTLADQIEASEVPDFMKIDDVDGMSLDFWESYDNSTRKNGRLTESLRGTVYKYFLDTIDNQGSRSYEDYCEKGYNTGNMAKKPWGDAAWAAKKLTRDQLEKMVAKEGTNSLASPVTNGFGEVIDPANDDREELNDEASEGDSHGLAFLKQIRKSVDEFDSKELTIEERVKEYFQKVYDTVERVASGRALKRHAFIYGDAGIGKSHTVGKAAKAGLAKWAGSGKKPTLVSFYGVIGKSVTPLLIFFFQNSKNKIIILDDADGFVKNDDEDVQNFLKAILDPESHKVTTPPTIRKTANKLYKDEMAESKKFISVDTSKLNEDKVVVTVGDKIFEYKVTDEQEKAQLRESFPAHKVTENEKRLVESIRDSRKNKTTIKYNRFGKLVTIKESDAFDDMDLDSIENDPYAAQLANAPEDDDLDPIPEEIPTSWYFTSSLIMVSNLSSSELNDAIKSRCDCRGISLTPEEFMVRAEMILPDFQIGKGSLTDPALIDWAKKESFAILKACFEDLKYKNSKIKMVIGINLELRIIPTLAGLLLARYDRWHEATNKQGDGPEVLQAFEKEQAAAYIKFDLLPVMAGDKALARK